MSYKFNGILLTSCCYGKKIFANRNHMKTMIYMYSIDSQYEIYLPTCIMESFLEYNDIGFCTLFKTWNIFINH